MATFEKCNIEPVGEIAKMSEESRDRSVGDNLVQSYLDLGGSAEDCAGMRAPPKQVLGNPSPTPKGNLKGDGDGFPNTS